MKLIKWEDFISPRYALITDNGKWHPTNIACPKCNGQLYRDTSIVLASYPPQYHYKCIHCGWTGTH